MVATGFHSRVVTDDWEHALISGNGSQGALCFGWPERLRVTLGHERLFLPVHAPLPAPHTAAILPALRSAVLAGRYQEAADAVVAHAIAGDDRYSELRQIDPLVAAATLTITGLPAAIAGSYRRAADFATGVVTQRWTGRDGGRFTQELFVSRADGVVVARLRHDGRPFDARLRLGRIEDTPPVRIDWASTVHADGIAVTAGFPDAWEGAISGYTTACRITAAGGSIVAERSALRCAGVTEVLLLARTEVPGRGAERALAGLRDVRPGWESLADRHARAHRPLVERCRLDLRATAAARSLRSEELLATPGQPALMELLFTAGRYAIASSTGALPPTLQGVWSGDYRPAWRSGYTLDGNLFTAVASALPTGAPELLLPVFDLLERHRDDFRHNARRLYGIDGIVLPPHLSTHGRHNHFDGRWCLTFWTAGAGWAAMLFYDYWRYTGDEVFLRERALPFMRAAAAFATRFITADGVLVPSYSPENAPAGTGSQAAVNATMDIAVLRALVAALDAAGEKPAGLAALLPGYRIDPDGTLAEWAWPGLDANHAHRHASHLIGLWYLPDPALLGDPALRAAARATVLARLAWWRDSDRVTNGGGSGDGGGRTGPAAPAGEMAFGLVHLGLAAAALGLGEACHEVLTWLAGAYWRPNLVATHNAGAIFNVDICGGLPALVAAMLLGSAPGHLDLLPALPAAWPAGEITGLAARGQIGVDRLTWSPASVTVRLRSARAQRVRLTCRDSARAEPRWVEVPAAGTVEVTIARGR